MLLCGSAPPAPAAAATGGCALCFRAIQAGGRRWSACAPQVLHAALAADAPPYADIVRNGMLPSSSSLTSTSTVELCEYCAGFVKSNTTTTTNTNNTNTTNKKRRRQPNKKRQRHGMHLTVNHILSGGCLPAPTRPYFLRCLALLEADGHPFLLGLQDLRDRVEARARLHGVDYAVVRWLFDGQPRVLGDGRLAKRIRKSLCWPSASSASSAAAEEDHTNTNTSNKKEAFDRYYYARQRAMQDLLRLGVEACRFCVARAAAPTLDTTPRTSYQGALVFGARDSPTVLRNMNDALLQFEERQDDDDDDEPTTTTTTTAAGGRRKASSRSRRSPSQKKRFFCVRCQRFSVVSYEYHCALRARLCLSAPGPTTADAYYAQQLQQPAPKKK